MINHVVLMKFNSNVEERDIEELEDMLNDLPNKIIEIHSYEFGRDIIGSPGSYDFALVSLFANPEALERYRQHRHHKSVVEKIKKICDSVVAVDFQASDAGSVNVERTGWDITPF